MFISLQQLESRTIPFQIDVPPGDIDFDAKLKQLSALHGEGRAQLLNHSLGEIRVTGDIAVTMEGICDRCAESAGYALTNHFDLVYMRTAKLMKRVSRSGTMTEADSN